MKIGLMTVYYPNYGSYFQAIALKEQLEEMGHDCELINATVRGKYIIKFCLGVLGKQTFPAWICEIIAKRNTAFRIYLSLEASLRKEKISRPFKSLTRLSQEYDCILIGSDELWSASLWEMKYIPAYFGIGIKCPHFSYATSAASLNFNAKLPWDEMGKGLNSFRTISARDEKTCKYVQSVTNKKCIKCLDPVLLNPYFIKTGTKTRNYLLVYGVEFRKKDIIKIKTYACKHKLKIRGIAWKHNWLDEFYDISSPEDFLVQFAESRFCAVSTFHGIVFSILYQKPFAAFLTKQRTPKVLDLLKTLGLCFRIVSNSISAIDDLDNIDYFKINKQLMKLRKQSIDYLTESLKMIDEGGRI